MILSSFLSHASHSKRKRTQPQFSQHIFIKKLFYKAKKIQSEIAQFSIDQGLLVLHVYIDELLTLGERQQCAHAKYFSECLSFFLVHIAHWGAITIIIMTSSLIPMTSCFTVITSPAYIQCIPSSVTIAIIHYRGYDSAAL